MPELSSAELTAALDSLQAWADAHPEHLRVLVGTRHTITQTQQNAIDCGLNYFGAQLLAESVWAKQQAQEFDSVTLVVDPTRDGMPPYWVVVSTRPMLFAELVAALSARHAPAGPAAAVDQENDDA